MRAFAIAGLILILTGMIDLARAAAPVPERLRAAISRIDALAAVEHAKDNVGSLTVGVVSGNKLVWTKSYGFADMENRIPANADTVYRIGSVTKSFTGLMLLQLVQDGKVTLSDPVEKYFPEINKLQSGAPPRITLEQLATMKSGLPREPANVSTYSRGRVSDWEKILIAALPQTRHEFSPGTRYVYSNIGYAILGAALARAAGTPYVQYVQERILAPLKMEHTTFESTDAIRARIAKGYDLDSAGQLSSAVAMRGHDGRGLRSPLGACIQPSAISRDSSHSSWAKGPRSS